jgi:hypothetical protein
MAGMATKASIARSAANNINFFIIYPSTFWRPSVDRSCTVADTKPHC